VFSVLKNKWEIFPKRSEPTVDEKNVSKKTDDLMNRIDSLTSIQNKITGLKNLKDKIMKMRRLGLEREGEFSEENLVFKNLRNSGYIGKLNDIIKSEYDDSLSLV
jgi:tRNA splicing endonuclease